MNPQGANQAEVKSPVDLAVPKQSPALRRFNFLFVYIPIALVALATLSILVWLIIIGLNSEGVVAKKNLSVLADILLVIFLVPAAFVCGFLPLALLFLGAQIKRRNLSASRSVLKIGQRLRKALTAIEIRSATARRTIIRPLIYLYGVGAFVGTLVRAVSKMFKRR